MIMLREREQKYEIIPYIKHKANTYSEHLTHALRTESMCLYLQLTPSQIYDVTWHIRFNVSSKRPSFARKIESYFII
jgi:hypothetical protein